MLPSGRGCALMNSKQLWLPAQAQPAGIPRVPRLTEELLAVDCCWGNPETTQLKAAGLWAESLQG